MLAERLFALGKAFVGRHQDLAEADVELWR